MKKYVAPFACAVVGFVLLGPLGLLLGLVVWLLVNGRTTTATKK